MDTLVTIPQIQARLREYLSPVQLEVMDESYLHKGHAGANAAGVGTHFFIRIQSSQFKGKPLLARHRLVYAALGELMPRIHALRLQIDE